MAQHRRQQRLRWAALTAAFVALAAAASFEVATGGWPAFPSGPSSADSKEAHAGTIVVETTTGECKKMKFDNDSGEITGDFRCDGSVLDSQGVPVPTGTIHRLNAIEDSFRGK
jgi:hypothetical protein